MPESAADSVSIRLCSYSCDCASVSDYPVRIELWGDEIDTVASFDIDTQRRIDTVKSVSITPCGETIFEEGVLARVRSDAGN